MSFSLFIYLFNTFLLNFASNLALWHFSARNSLLLLIYSFGPITSQDGGSGHRTKKRLSCLRNSVFGAKVVTID